MDNIKDQFYDIMIDFIAIERKVEALLVVLHTLQDHFEYEDDKLYCIVSTITWHIEMIYQELKKNITAADTILLDKNNSLEKDGAHD